MGTTDGTIAKWLKAEGDAVIEGEVLVEIEFAKAIQEVAAPASGVLTKILLREGETAAVFTDIAVIEEEG
jgi:pyruvate dehydrogenase E2 component (dihydrolipoamide acetyltransferase)